MLKGVFLPKENRSGKVTDLYTVKIDNKNMTYSKQC